MMEMNHWETEKGKQMLYTVFSTLVEIEDDRWQQVDTTKIKFVEILFTLKLKAGWTGWTYEDDYVMEALKELRRLGLVRMTKHQDVWISRKGWEFWIKRGRKLKGAWA